MHEIVTLSSGNYSSFVLSHFYNIQEASFSFDPDVEPEVDHAVLFQENSTADVCHLAYGNFRTQRVENVLFNPRRDHLPHHLSSMPGTVERHETRPFKKNQFLRDIEQEELELMDLERTRDSKHHARDEDEVSEAVAVANPAGGSKKYRLVESDVSQWSDFLAVYLHPRSLNMINDNAFGSERKFDSFPFGEGFFRNADNYEQYFEGNVRSFVEGCDNLQGFHSVADITDAFGGFGCALLDAIREEYPKKSILAFGTAHSGNAGPSTKEQIQKEILNEAFAVASMHESSSVYVPFVTPHHISSPWLPHYNPKSRYHSSALLGTFLDSCTLPYRRRRSTVLLGDLVGQLNWRNSTRIADATLIFPFPLKQDRNFEDVFSDSKALSSATFLLSRQSPLQLPFRANAESLVVRGCSRIPMFANAQPTENLARYRKCRSAKEMLYEYLRDIPRTSSQGHEFSEPLQIPKTFPPLFGHVNSEGQITDTSKVEAKSSHFESDTEVGSVSCVSMLRNSDTTKVRITHLVNGLKSLNPKLHPTFFENRDTFDETLEQLENLLSSFE